MIQSLQFLFTTVSNESLCLLIHDEMNLSIIMLFVWSIVFIKVLSFSYYKTNFRSRLLLRVIIKKKNK